MAPPYEAGVVVQPLGGTSGCTGQQKRKISIEVQFPVCPPVDDGPFRHNLQRRRVEIVALNPQQEACILLLEVFLRTPRRLRPCRSNGDRPRGAWRKSLKAGNGD